MFTPAAMIAEISDGCPWLPLCVASEHGLVSHLDGARLWNAAVAEASDAPEAYMSRVGGMFDSVSLCFSKGLGAPVGSVLVGPADFIDLARQYRKLMVLMIIHE